MKRIAIVLMLAVGCGSPQGTPYRVAPVQEPKGSPRALEEQYPEDTPIPPGASDTAATNTTRVENGVKVIVVNRQPWCFPVADDKMCGGDQARCQNVARKLKQDGAVCSPQDWTVCFLATHVMSGVQDAWCFGSMDACRTMRLDFSTDRNRSGVTECVVMRYEAR